MMMSACDVWEGKNVRGNLLHSLSVQKIVAIEELKFPRMQVLQCLVVLIMVTTDLILVHIPSIV